MSGESWLQWCLTTFLHPQLLAWHALTLFLLGTVVFSLGRALVFFLFSVARTGRLLWHTRRNQQSIPEKLSRCLCRVGIHPSFFRLIADTKPQLYCLGFLQPVVVMSDSLVDLLSETELTAALSHEAYHFHHRHSLRLLLAETGRELFWFMPVVAELVQYWRYRAEAHADHHAVSEGSDALRSALRKLLATPVPAWQIGLTSSPAAARVHTLLSGQVLPFQPSWLRIQQSCAAAGMLVLLTTVLCLTNKSFPQGAGMLLAGTNHCVQPLFTPNIR